MFHQERGDLARSIQPRGGAKTTGLRDVDRRQRVLKLPQSGIGLHDMRSIHELSTMVVGGVRLPSVLLTFNLHTHVKLHKTHGS